MNGARRGPMLFEGDDPALGAGVPHTPADAPPPPEPGAPPPATLRAARLAAGKRSRFARIVWSALGGLVSLAIGVAVWDFIGDLVSRNAALGTLALGLTGVLIAGLVVFGLREAAGLARLGRIDTIRTGAEKALRDSDRKAALATLGGLRKLYASRADMEWALADLKAREPDMLDADGAIEQAERALMADLDRRAARSAGAAARAVAAATAFVPLALVDVLAALFINLRMIREIAEIYGGRAGALGSWRLLRGVAGHLIATGAVAVGDDLIGPALGGGALSRVSRRFGEGLINGALTARIGASAIAVCRPLPFRAIDRPTGRGIAAGALRGLWSTGGANGR